MLRQKLDWASIDKKEEILKTQPICIKEKKNRSKNGAYTTDNIL